MSLDDGFAEAMGTLLGPDFPSDIGLAVSGGGDSMAMLTLAHNWTRRWGVRLWVLTVDHGLRPESAAEAALVAETCAELGHPHATARWHWDGQGNLQDAARRARLGLIGRWRGGIGHVLMAHTADDVAETFLMRLARGAGIDGLAAMAPRRRVMPGPAAGDIEGRCPPGQAAGAFDILRPCLGMHRADLRHYLRTLQGRWVEDPSNEDPRFDRVRMRRLVAALGAEGIGAEALSAAARRLAEETVPLRRAAAALWQAQGAEHEAPAGRRTGVLRLSPDWYRGADRATQRRLLSAIVRFVSGADYAPRGDALETFRDRLVSGGGGTVHGCMATIARDAVWLFREAAAVAPRMSVGDATLWDNRWRVAQGAGPELSVGALGEAGWRQATGSGATDLPYRAALSLPALWDGDTLVACDALGVGPGDTVTFCPRGDSDLSLPAFLDSH